MLLVLPGTFLQRNLAEEAAAALQVLTEQGVPMKGEDEGTPEAAAGGKKDKKKAKGAGLQSSQRKILLPQMGGMQDLPSGFLSPVHVMSSLGCSLITGKEVAKCNHTMDHASDRTFALLRVRSLT